MTDAGLPSTPARPAVVAAVDVQMPTVFITCPTCGIACGLPLEVYLGRIASGGVVHCCDAHPIRLEQKGRPTTDVFKITQRLSGDLRTARAELEQLRGAVLRMEAAAAAGVKPDASQPLSKEELNRRVNLLASRAETSKGTRPICPYCGRNYHSTYDYRRHLKTKHVAEITASRSIGGAR